MPKSKQDKNLPKPPKMPSGLSKNERRALRIQLKNPEMEPGDIGREMVRLGHVRDPKYVFQRLNQKQLVRQSYTENKEYLAELLVRDCGPTVIKNYKRTIKNKDLEQKNPGVWLKANKDILDKVMPDSTSPFQPTQVNIGQLQAVINNNMSNDDASG